MRALYHQFYSSSVRREKDELLAESYFLSTRGEAVASLRADVSSFEVREARWDIYRSPDGGPRGGRSVPEIKGMVAYFEDVHRILRTVGDEGGGLPRELIAECVKAIIQAETYVYRERGFPTTRDYDQHWNRMYLNGCRYYSHLDRVTLSWYDYVGDPDRQGCLFNRCKSCTVHQMLDGTIVACGSFSDTFHELGVSLLLTGSGLVTAVSGNFLRPPDPVCVECEQKLMGLPGKNLARLTKKETAALIGGAEGCLHLLDLVNDLRRAAAVVVEELARPAEPRPSPLQ